MTECPKCKGYGIVGSAVPDILRGRGHIFSSIECPQCHGSGEVPMTNEEWLHTLNTEQLAEEVYKLVWCSNELFQQMECSGIDTKENDLKIVIEWLKQPHTNE